MKMKKLEIQKPKLSLPTSFSKPSTSLGDYSILLYGEKKIGKTSLATMFPDNFLMSFEPGAKALIRRERFVHNWDEFKGYIRLLEKDKTFKTVTIDTIDICYKHCSKYVCGKLVIDHLSDEDWGKGWEAGRDEFTGELNRLLGIGKGIIFLSHAADKEIKTRTGDKYHRIAPTMSSQARDILEGVVDIWAYYCYEGSSRKLFIQGDDHIGAGHRLENQFKYLSGNPIKAIPMGKNKEEAYQNFIKAFNNQLELPKGGSNEKSLIAKKPVMLFKKIKTN